jgi:hypothetical protein
MEPRLPDPSRLLRRRLSDLIREERPRGRFHVQLIRNDEPEASDDRVAQVLLQRWSRVAAVEGGLTGAAGLFGVPLNWVLFTYCQVALTVSIAEAYGRVLEGPSGEDAVLDVIGRSHGVQGLVRASPRVLGALARSLALRQGLSSIGRLVPLVAVPISARLNHRGLERTGREALRRFGNVIMLT